MHEPIRGIFLLCAIHAKGFLFLFHECSSKAIVTEQREFLFIIIDAVEN